MNFSTALERDALINKTVGPGWKFNCVKLPDDSNVNATWSKGKWHISCGLHDDTEFHFSVGLGVGVSFTATDKDPRLAALKASHKVNEALQAWNQEYQNLSQIFTR